jgi:hypothetical protein
MNLRTAHVWGSENRANGILVSGKTTVKVYEDIKAHAPRVAQNATFAFTIIATKTGNKTTVAQALRGQ